MSLRIQRYGNIVVCAVKKISDTSSVNICKVRRKRNKYHVIVYAEADKMRET